MKALDKTATRIFMGIVAKLKDGYVKIDNTKGTFMPLSVDYLGPIKAGKTYAFAHNFVQEGDVMADPDMQFLVVDTPDGPQVYAWTFQQDSVGLFQDAIEFSPDGSVKGFKPRLQADLTAFANQWMRNIRDQQGL